MFIIGCNYKYLVMWIINLSCFLKLQKNLHSVKTGTFIVIKLFTSICCVCSLITIWAINLHSFPLLGLMQVDKRDCDF